MLNSTTCPTVGTTEFAPPDRKPLEEAAIDFESLARHPILRDVLNAVSEACALLNQARQIVYANDALISLLNIKDPRSLWGIRPGEAFSCVHAFERLEGCGTTEACRTCGAVSAILVSQAGTDDVRECRILQKDGGALDLRIRTKQLWIEGQEYVLLSAIDISHEKRRRVLEHIFFHDILNTAGALYGFSDLLLNTPQEDDSHLQTMRLLSKRLLDEITAQRQLLAAEHNELTIEPVVIQSLKFIESVSLQHGPEPSGKSYSIRIDPTSKDATFRNDAVLLKRVVGNLVKNATEASEDGDVITIGCRSIPQGIEFWVHNPAVMERGIQFQVFQRSFSTKGSGRGLGTYGAKLTTERYLKGHLSFKSTPGEGTIFSATYPVDPA